MAIFDKLFEWLFKCYYRLRKKRTKYSWVFKLLKGIDLAETKLDKYYNKMYSNIESVYIISTLLHLLYKQQAFYPDYYWL